MKLLKTALTVLFLLPVTVSAQNISTPPFPWTWFWSSIGIVVSIAAVFYIRRIINLHHILFAIEHHIFITSEEASHRHDVVLRIASTMRKGGVDVGEFDASHALFSKKSKKFGSGKIKVEPTNIPEVKFASANKDLSSLIDKHDMLVLHEITPALYQSTELKDVFKKAMKSRKPIISTMNLSAHEHFNERGRIVDVTDKDPELIHDVIVKRLKDGPFGF